MQTQPVLMNDPSSSSAALLARVRRLERRARLWRMGLGVGVLASLAPWLLAAQRSGEPASDLKVTSLALVDAQGKERGSLRLENGSPVLVLRDGSRHVMLTLSDGAAGLASKGDGGVVFAGVTGEGAYFNARGHDLKAGVYAGVGKDLSASFRGYASDMASATSLDVGADRSARLTLSDPVRGSTSLPAAAH